MDMISTLTARFLNCLSQQLVYQKPFKFLLINLIEISGNCDCLIYAVENDEYGLKF